MMRSSIKALIRQKPPVVQQALRIIATKHWVDLGDSVDASDNAQFEQLFAGAIREWDLWVSKAREIAADMTESELAEAIIGRLRSDPKHGWDRILRGHAN